MGSSLFRTGELRTAEQLQRLTETLKQGSVHQVSFWQLNTPHYEWERIIAEHELFLNVNSSFEWAHIIIPSAHTFALHAELEPAPVTQRNVKRLARQINAEGWLTYCRWLSLKTEKVLATFIPTDADAYSLQAALEDFRHQVHSPLVKMYRQQIAAAYKEYHQPQSEGLELEKTIAGARTGMIEALEAHAAALQQIILGIPKISAAHPSVLPLLRPCRLLTAALDIELFEWIPAIILGELLDEALGITACVNSDSAHDRTSWGYAVRMAAAHLLHHSFNKEYVDVLAFNWEEHQFSPLANELKHYVTHLMQKIDPSLLKEAPSGKLINPAFDTFRPKAA